MRTRQECEDGILEALNNVGLFLESETLRTEPIGELIPDSITYISFIIELEQIFDIELPDDFLLIENLSTLDNLTQMLKNLFVSDDT